MNDEKLLAEYETISAEMLNTERLLGGDIKMCDAALREDDSQFWRRTYVRALFAYIEGLNYLKKVHAFQAHLAGRVKYTKAELSVILEESYELNNQGEAVERTSFKSLDKNLRFAFQVYARIYDICFKVDCSGLGWQSFKTAIKIRNRVTHPKRLSDLSITDDELQTLDETLEWYVQNNIALRLLEREVLQNENELIRHKQGLIEER